MELTPEIYEEWIPPSCILQNYKDHAEHLMLCWGLCLDIEKEIYVRDCPRHCDYHKNFDQEMMKRIFRWNHQEGK